MNVPQRNTTTNTSARPGRKAPPRRPFHPQRRGSRPPRPMARHHGSPAASTIPRRTNPATRELHRTSTGERLLVTALGGMEEVGLNMTVVEYVPATGPSDIVIIDMGLKFPEEDQPGVDYMIPNITSLRGKEKQIRGVIITHGHYDHIGGIPHLIPKLGSPIVYGTPFTNAIIKKRQDDFPDSVVKQTNVNVDEELQLGRFRVEFVHVNHNIPGSVAVVVHSPVGTIIHTGDWKFDLTPANEKPADLAKFARLGSAGVLALLGDSTNAWIPGHQVSEQEIGATLRGIIEKAPGRIIVGSFASLLSRLEQVTRFAEEYGRKIAVDGFSMKTNVEIAKQMGYIKVNQSSLIDISEVNRYPNNKVLIMCTGAQGEGRAVLMRIANGEHRFVNIEPTDTVIFSSSVVPGNERSVQRLQDTLYRKGAEVIHYQMMDVHAGGHGKTEDVKLLLTLVRPQYYIPIEGNHFMLRLNARNAEKLGMAKDHILIADNGQVMEFARHSNTPNAVTGRLTNEIVPTDAIMVDGLGVGDVSEIVLRDRQLLAADGMIVVIATVEKKTGKILGNPDIISRGFVYLKENKEMIDEVRHHVKKTVQDHDPLSQADEYEIKNKIRESVGQLILTRTQRRPMVLPVVIEV